MTLPFTDSSILLVLQILLYLGLDHIFLIELKHLQLIASGQMKLPSALVFPRAQSWALFFLSYICSPYSKSSKTTQSSIMQSLTTTNYTNKAHPDQIQQTAELMETCTADVKSWMTINKLQLNDSKTESILVKSRRLSAEPPLPSVRVGNSDVLRSFCEKPWCHT